MSIANLHVLWVFIHVIHPLPICKYNLQATMAEEDCEHKNR